MHVVVYFFEFNNRRVENIFQIAPKISILGGAILKTLHAYFCCASDELLFAAQLRRSRSRVAGIHFCVKNMFVYFSSFFDHSAKHRPTWCEKRLAEFVNCYCLTYRRDYKRQQSSDGPNNTQCALYANQVNLIDFGRYTDLITANICCKNG